MLLDADWPHARAAAAMRDAEGLVQIEVAHVSANVARPREADERIHVGAVEVDLAAVGVGDRADFAHRLLEHAVGRWIGDHAAPRGFASSPRPWRGSRRGRCCLLRSVATTTTFMPHMDRRRGIGAVRGGSG